LENQIVLDGHKMLWHRDRVEQWLRGERFAPINIEFALTRSCTYKCVYCYGQLQDNDIKKMTWQVLKDFIDDCSEIGVKSINLTSDGESTCSPYFVDTIVYGKHKGLDVACATNGYLLPSNVRTLKDILSNLTYLRFNVSAGEPKTYSKVHGVPEEYFNIFKEKVSRVVGVKKTYGLPVTIGLQMVLLPQYEDQIMPLALLGKDLGVDYLVIKHCSDDEFHTLGIDYQKYFDMVPTIKRAEALTTKDYLVQAKWSKLLSGGKRTYNKCYGPAFMLQISGSGLVAPCGMLFNDRYKDEYHLGNITETRFKDIWASDRYWNVMEKLATKFDALSMCGSLCLQHKVNEYLWALKQENIDLEDPKGPPPQHINFP